jgi:hypothetical protein
MSIVVTDYLNKIDNIKTTVNFKLFNDLDLTNFMVKFNSLFTINKSIFKTSIEEDKFIFLKKVYLYML